MKAPRPGILSLPRTVARSVVAVVILSSSTFLSGTATIAAQTPTALRPYEGLLRESDPRLGDLRRLLKEGKSLPEELRLRYRGTQGNYAVFYDLEGREALYRYRRDPFDDLGVRKLRDLRPGQAYRLRGEFVGFMDEGVVHSPGSERFAAVVASAGGQPVFLFGSAENIQTDSLIL